MSKRHNISRLVIFPFKKISQLHSFWARLALRANYLRPPIPRLRLGAIFGIMPHFITIETCSFGFCPNISLRLAPFERSHFLHEISLGLEPRALELFRLFLPWTFLSSVLFSLMVWLLMKELVVLFDPGFLTPSHIREAFHFHDGFG